jgi:hypothetical protein
MLVHCVRLPIWWDGHESEVPKGYIIREECLADRATQTLTLTWPLMALSMLTLCFVRGRSDIGVTILLD